MKKLLFVAMSVIIMVSCASNAIIREYKYSYKMKSADDVLYDIITIVENEGFPMANKENTRQSINTTHGMFFVDIVETGWNSIGILNEDGKEYELKYRIWVSVEGSMKVTSMSNVTDAYDDSPNTPIFAENVISIESFIRIMENGEYKIKDAVPRLVFTYLETVPIKISGILEHTGLSKESELRLQQEGPKINNKN